MRVKVMLHPVAASTLRGASHSIENNCAGFISWSRLTDALADAGELKDHEEVEAFVLTDDGIQLFVKRK